MDTLPKNKIPISITMPIWFLCKLDEYLKKTDKSRSEFVFETLKEKIIKE